MEMETIGTPLLWGVFALVVVGALLVDLVLMRHGGPHRVTFKEAAWWSLGWVALALAFNTGLWWYARHQYGAAAGHLIGMEFLTGYLVE
jgi:tellurite resistance protein TerC